MVLTCRDNRLRSHNFTVQYDTSSHWSVMTQCWGSVWPKVLPYCVFNLVVGMLLTVFKNDLNLTIHISARGHGWLTLIVAFLVVSRASVSLGRYNQARAHLTAISAKTREFVHNMALMSSDNTDQKGSQWRHDVSYCTMILLRCMMSVISYETEKIPSWELAEMDPDLAKAVKGTLFLGPETMVYTQTAHVSEEEENMRVPIRLAMKLRRALRSQRTQLSDPFPTIEENKLFGSIDGLMAGYYNIRTFKTTPFPFPVVQMSRTFLFLYVFTVPFALLDDEAGLLVHAIVLFFITYGFMGLEYVSIELDDPFGDDDNDFKNTRLAEVAFEDTYLTILELDGEEWTDKLRKRMYDPKTADQLPRQAAEWLLPNYSDGGAAASGTNVIV